MGPRLSIDKHVSSLDELLDMSPQYFNRVKFESKISPVITQHLKIWRFSEDKSKFDSVKITPVALALLKQSNFHFNRHESYLVVLISKNGLPADDFELNEFPSSLWPLVQSADSLTPRGLQSHFTATEKLTTDQQSKSPLLQISQTEGGQQQSDTFGEFKYSIYIWNGKDASSMTKALTLAKGNELEMILSKAKDDVMRVLFSGGVIRGKKLQRGSVYTFVDVDTTSKVECPVKEWIGGAYQRIQLLQKVYPVEGLMEMVQDKKAKFSLLQQHHLQHQSQTNGSNASNGGYWNCLTAIDKPQQSQQAASTGSGLNIKAKEVAPPMVINKLNLGNLNQQPDSVSTNEETKAEPNRAPVPPGFSLNLNLGNINKQQAAMHRDPSLEDIQDYQENNHDSQRDKQTPQSNPIMLTGATQNKVPPLGGLGMPPLSLGSVTNGNTNVPSLNLGGVQLANDSLPSRSSQGGNDGPSDSNRPKMQLDLSKAKSFQQEHLKMAAQSKLNANEIAQLNVNQHTQGYPNNGMFSNLNDANPDSQYSQPLQAARGGQTAPNPNQKTQGQGSGGPRPDFNAQHLNIEPDQLNDEDFDFKGTSRKEYENEFYKNICSEVMQGFLYLGSDIVAKNQSMLQSIGITHVVNCAADYSEDYLKDLGVKYKSYHLKDHTREDIACVFYDAISFMQRARDEGGKVYVHCVQGISRSATICIAYKIFTEKCTYDEAYEQIKKGRMCANPNLNFITQLIQFYKRLYDPNFDSCQLVPRVFLVASHQEEDPECVVARLIMVNLYVQGSAGSARQGKVLDPRFIFVIQTVDKIYLWVGSEVPQANYQPYMRAAEQHIALLQKYERGADKVITVKQFSEGQDFWHQFGISASNGEPKLYSKVDDWHRIFIDLGLKRQQAEKTVISQIDEYERQVAEEQLYKVKLFTWPDWRNPTTIMDFEDLENDETFMVLCARAKPDELSEEPNLRKEDMVFVWHGAQHTVSQDEQSAFVEKCIELYYGPEFLIEGSKEKQRLKLQSEYSTEETETFNQFFFYD